MAHGGYGRRHLAPLSDIDLMILHDTRQADLVRQFTTRLTQDVFDCGLKLGHSLRTPSDAVNLARTDPVICTSLVESRPIVGSMNLFDSFWKNFRGMVDRRKSTLCREFIQARRDERQKYGETVFLLEPNIKRSRGGLRDTHLLRWLWFVKTGIADPDRLVAIKVLSRFDHHRLRSARDFLLQVRNQMHFFRQSRLRSPDPRGATRSGPGHGPFVGRDGLLPVEQFMREYFRHSTHVAFLANRMIDLAAPPSGMRQVLDPVLSISIARDYRVGLQEVSATQLGATKLKTRIDEVLRLVNLARLHDRRIAQETWYLIYRAAPNYSTQLGDETVERFVDLLGNPLQLGEALRRLRDLGVLERIITQFTHARGLLQFNQYHKYTVDEHCIRAVEEATRLVDRDDYAGQRYRRLKNKTLLHLALLIHDLGKGYEEDHAMLGEQFADDIADRLHLEVYERDTLKFLVRKHLSLAHAAFRRDTSDPDLLKAFAEEVGSVERLDMLYLLTCADLAAVGPGVLNAWKVGVLSQLRQRIEDALVPDGQFFEQARRRKLQDEVWKQLPAESRDDAWFDEQFDALTESYLSGHSTIEIAHTLNQLRPLAARQGTAWGSYRADSNTVGNSSPESIKDRGAGFSRRWPASSPARRMRILSAETVGLARGLLLLRYVVEDSETATASDTARIADGERANGGRHR